MRPAAPTARPVPLRPGRAAWVLLPLVAGLGCSDYNFQPEGKAAENGVDTGTVAETPDPDPDPGAPAIAALPGAIELGVLCAETAVNVELSNQGDAALTISSLSAGGAWTVTDPGLPLSLPPGDAVVVELVGGPGNTTLSVLSDDPATPVLEVPVSSAVDVPPSVSIVDPADGDTIGVSAATSFAARVADDISTEEVELVWSSDVDGDLSTTFPDASGDARLAWDGTLRSAGTHVVTLTGTDTCGNVVSDEITVCQNEGYLADSLDLSTWNFEGSALWDAANSWVELTAPLNNQSGTAFQTAATVDATNVQVEFSFYVSGGTGADGISVTAIDASRMTTFVGGTGGGIGYRGLPGWSIEVDTWYNAEHNDPTPEDHLSLHLDGNVDSPLVWAALPEMEDGNWHTMAVSVVGTHVTVEIDGTTHIDQTVSGLSSFPAYVGFTAATGGSTNHHLIDALQVEQYVCDE